MAVGLAMKSARRQCLVAGAGAQHNRDETLRRARGLQLQLRPVQQTLRLLLISYQDYHPLS